jgi:hypothetical protein
VSIRSALAPVARTAKALPPALCAINGWHLRAVVIGYRAGKRTPGLARAKRQFGVLRHLRSVLRRPETTKRGLSNVVTIVAAEKRIKAKTGLFGSATRVSINELEEQGRAAHVDKR